MHLDPPVQHGLRPSEVVRLTTQDQAANPERFYLLRGRLLRELEAERPRLDRSSNADLRRGQVLTEGPDQEQRSGDDPHREPEHYGVLHDALKIEIHTSMMPVGAWRCIQDPLVRSSLSGWATRRRRPAPSNR